MVDVFHTHFGIAGACTALSFHSSQAVVGFRPYPRRVMSDHRFGLLCMILILIIILHRPLHPRLSWLGGSGSGVLHAGECG